jgi:hypothetical protein
MHIIVTVLVLLDFLPVILARGCRAKNPGLFWPAQTPDSGFLAHARHARENDTINCAEAKSL